jgi:hypothetical protein
MFSCKTTTTPPEGLLADNVYQTLVDIEDPEARKSRILATAERAFLRG